MEQYVEYSLLLGKKGKKAKNRDRQPYYRREADGCLSWFRNISFWGHGGVIMRRASARTILPLAALSGTSFNSWGLRFLSVPSRISTKQEPS